MTRRSWLSNVRRRARRRLPALLETQGGRCFWCHEVLRTEGIDMGSRASRRLMATVDHLRPLRDSGPETGDDPNDPANLVAACENCNARRDAFKTSRTAPDRPCAGGCGKMVRRPACGACNRDVWWALEGALPGEVG